MPLIVHALGAYASYSKNDIPWRPDDYNVNKFIKALKGKPIVGYGSLPSVRGGTLRYTQDSPVNALILFGYWGVDRLRALNFGQVVLVPVPSSTYVDFAMHTAPTRMAQFVQVFAAGNPHVTVGRWLKFNRVMKSASADGGTRNFRELVDALAVSPDVVPGSHVVLVDDVKTTGAHLRACAHLLRNAGAHVEIVLVGAATVWEQHSEPLAVQPVDLEWNPFN
jgi:hypothetical protein